MILLAVWLASAVAAFEIILRLRDEKVVPT
jgi:hypothetical protein